MSVLAKAGLAAVLIGGAGAGGIAYMHADTKTENAPVLTLTIKSANGPHVFVVERAKTAAEQERGLMYRTDLKPDGGMLFWPYPADGGAPVNANFWMKNTPSPLDILYIRADRTIARIADNTVPFSEAPIPSGEPVGAVLELMGGRSAELGIAEGDRVTWDESAK
ncbi:DUF192 domain-containing protein [Sphingomonas sp. PP-CE-1G-424]|jgi:uncharacterized membrane protein (UPF0127 family)|uniref:DUF192 domain-containing protein n=1 Tax=Sphingomonas sp. PP-CE-1G-424 TaxID=2135658 RepID=UPI0010546669|nr:DUF192 domain-containing protein [Sphingomonas sp. PP-CE-1G-424]TCP71412.1 hypothetical protein C8J43_102491 [Sphingomonas sp. PP-CE-1G-424]